MAVKQLTDTEANALSTGGVTDTDTGVRYPSADADPWLAPIMRTLGRLSAVAQLAANLRVDEVEGNADAVLVLPGRCTIDGTVYSFAGVDPAVDGLADNDTTYIWAEDTNPGTPTGTLQINSAIDGTGWPGTNHLKLAEVTMASGEITGIVDRRLDGIFSA